MTTHTASQVVERPVARLGHICRAHPTVPAGRCSPLCVAFCGSRIDVACSVRERAWILAEVCVVCEAMSR